uniref:Uncharacterized protein n=1 Tax=Haptolina brevifila TaxID=156173 RepID=A0A7S2NFL6_9EUKA|mmetsp:Transcript_77059/g.152927  ORF Transcript_77059/g.152927 Transcript_77059/m.152927 type:complete len:120 (+) Transcript_77059:460-819(+)
MTTLTGILDGMSRTMDKLPPRSAGGHIAAMDIEKKEHSKYSILKKETAHDTPILGGEMAYIKNISCEADPEAHHAAFKIKDMPACLRGGSEEHGYRGNATGTLFSSGAGYDDSYKWRSW